MIDLKTFDEKIKKFSNYIEKLPYDSKIKSLLNDQEFIRKNPPYYLYYPELFAKAFNYNDKKQIDLLCFAGFFYYKHLIILDEINDNNHSKGLIHKLLLTANICQEESVKILATLFPLNSKFWKFWNLRKIQYGKGLEYDKNASLVKNYKDFESFANVKSSIGKVAIDALNIMSGNKNIKLYNEIIDSHRWFYCGFQILDDVIDFREDIENKQTNIAKIQLEKKLEPGVSYNSSELEKLLFIKGVAEELLKKSQFYYNKANDLALKYELSLWSDVIKLNIAESIRRDFHIKTFLKAIQVRINLERENKNVLKKDISIKRTDDSLNNLLVDSFSFIFNSWKKGFGELQHVLYLPKIEGFETKEEFHYSDIFQRAIITDSLIDANPVLKGELSELIAHEISYLKSKRLTDFPGGWSYLPTIKEVAADADDLGQMLQVLMRNNEKDYVEKMCQTTIDVLHNSCICDDGGIETWIIPKKDRTQLQERQYKFNTSKWGTGPDNEVMANYLYGLSLYNNEKYNSIINKGIDYLLSKQSAQGYWSSRWYYGNYYGTYTCIRLIKRVKDDYNLLRASGDFLLVSQNEDGGWGDRAKSDALNTSLSILCLCQLMEYEQSKYEASLIKAIEFLKKLHRDNKLFMGVPFIKPRTNDPYISKTLTASYLLKAVSQIIMINKHILKA